MPRVLIQSAACALVSCTLLACQASGAASPESVTSPAGSNASQPPAAGAAIQPSAAGEAAGVAGTAGMKPAVDAGAPSVSPVANAPQIARSSVAPNAQPVIADAEYPTFISHINQFGLELGQQLASGDLEQKNLVYSPLSATLALGMTYAGAKGRTATEMKTVLGDSFAPGVFHTAANRLMRELASRERESSMSSSEQPKLELNLADSIFVDRSLTLQASFLDLLSREYDIGVGQVDFSTASEAARLGINAWVQEQTKDKIKDLLAPDAITFRTRLVLVNALYFLGSWAVAFPESATQPAPFTTLAGSALQAPAMNVVARLSYGAGDAFELVELPYTAGLSLVIVLPAAGMFEPLRRQLSEAWLQQALGKLGPALVTLRLPKFKIETDRLELGEGLQKLGMKQAFELGADFSGISTGTELMISDVVQKAFIAIDEKGTEAAAATAVVASVPPSAQVPVDPPKTFSVDRPFLFVLRDRSGAVLFVGHVVDPSK